jgi:hypothetical protein
MVVARKRRPQTTQRMLDRSGAVAVKRESGRLAGWVDMKKALPRRVGLTIAR